MLYQIWFCFVGWLRQGRAMAIEGPIEAVRGSQGLLGGCWGSLGAPWWPLGFLGATLVTARGPSCLDGGRWLNGHLTAASRSRNGRLTVAYRDKQPGTFFSHRKKKNNSPQISNLSLNNTTFMLFAKNGYPFGSRFFQTCPRSLDGRLTVA